MSFKGVSFQPPNFLLVRRKLSKLDLANGVFLVLCQQGLKYVGAELFEASQILISVVLALSFFRSENQSPSSKKKFLLLLLLLLGMTVGCQVWISNSSQLTDDKYLNIHRPGYL